MKPHNARCGSRFGMQPSQRAATARQLIDPGTPTVTRGIQRADCGRAFAAIALEADEGPADAVVSRIYVHPAHWGQGIGTTLLDNLFDALSVDGNDSVWVPVWAENDVGRSFNRTQGFEIEDRRPTELGDEEIDELVLVRDI